MATAALLGEPGGADRVRRRRGGRRRALADAGIALVEPAGRSRRRGCGVGRIADYAKIAAASVLVERGAALVATNADASYPAPEGSLPGAGALLAAVTTTTGAAAEIVGKPDAPLVHAALVRPGAGVRS